jgi:hypothetical protein
MVRLMNDAIETEAHEAQRANHNAVELIEPAIFPEQAVGRFVEADEDAMHQMADNKHEWNSQPAQSAVHGYGKRHFSENKTKNEKLKCTRSAQ